MSELLEHHVFAGLLNTKFRVVVDSPNQVELELIEVTELKISERQEEFTILFLGASDQFLGQGMRTLEHEVGTFDLFLVPVERAKAGIHYQAIFNRMIGIR